MEIEFLYAEEGGPAGGGGEPSGAEAGENPSTGNQGETGGEEKPQQIYKEQLKKDLRDHPALDDVQDFNDLTTRYISLQEQSNVVVPQSTDEYDFGEPEGERDEEFEKTYRELAFNNKLSNDQANSFLEGFAGYVTKRAQEKEAALKEAGESLMKELGTKGKARAELLLDQYGDADLKKAVLESPGQHEALLRIAAKAGALLEEDSLPDGTGGGGDSEADELKEMFPDMQEYFNQ